MVGAGGTPTDISLVVLLPGTLGLPSAIFLGGASWLFTTMYSSQNWLLGFILHSGISFPWLFDLGRFPCLILLPYCVCVSLSWLLFLIISFLILVVESCWPGMAFEPTSKICFLSQEFRGWVLVWPRLSTSVSCTMTLVPPYERLILGLHVSLCPSLKSGALTDVTHVTQGGATLRLFTNRKCTLVPGWLGGRSAGFSVLVPGHLGCRILPHWGVPPRRSHYV